MQRHLCASCFVFHSKRGSRCSVCVCVGFHLRRTEERGDRFHQHTDSSPPCPLGEVAQHGEQALLSLPWALEEREDERRSKLIAARCPVAGLARLPLAALSRRAFPSRLTPCMLAQQAHWVSPLLDLELILVCLLCPLTCDKRTVPRGFSYAPFLELLPAPVDSEARLSLGKVTLCKGTS